MHANHMNICHVVSRIIQDQYFFVRSLEIPIEETPPISMLFDERSLFLVVYYLVVKLLTNPYLARALSNFIGDIHYLWVHKQANISIE